MPTKLTVSAIVFLLAVAGHAVAQAPNAPTVLVSFKFPDGKLKSTEVTEAEVRALLNENFGYKVEWLVRGALAKLRIPHTIAVVEKTPKAEALVSVDGVENAGDRAWVLYVNGIRSPYHINTQTRDNVRSIRFVYQSANAQ